MALKLSLTLCAALFTARTLATEPQPPLWPSAFTVNATEGYTGKGSGKVSYAYDSQQKAEKWTRHTTGLYAQDNVCQGVDAPCTDLVVAGNRWIIHPSTGDCCLLGTWAEGCGPLVRDWIAVSNGTFAGTAVVNNVEADEWDVKGFSLNRYWSTADRKNVPVRLDQGGYVNVYDRDSFELAPRGLPASTFTVPPSCSASKPCKSQHPCDFR